MTITINATVNPAPPARPSPTRAPLSFDADGDGINEAGGVTDDPATPAADDPTAVVVGQSVVEVPTLSQLGLLVLGLLLGGAGFLILRR